MMKGIICVPRQKNARYKVDFLLEFFETTKKIFDAYKYEIGSKELPLKID